MGMVGKVKELLKAGILYSVGNALNSLIGFLLLPICTSQFSVDGYAVINLAILVGALSSTFTYLGASSSMLRFYYDYQSKDTQQKMVNSAFLIVALGGLFQLLVGFVFRGTFSNWVFSTPEYGYLLVLSLAFASVQTINTSFFILLRCDDKNVKYVTLNAVTLLLSIGIMIIWLRFEVELYVPIASQLIGNVAVMLIMALNYKIKLFDVKREEIKKILSFGIPVALSSLLFYLLNTSDQLIMKRLGSLYDVGIYGFGSKISMIIQSLLIVPFSMIWAQLRMKYKNSDGFDSFMTLVGAYYILAASTAALLFIYLGKELVNIASLGNEEYIASLSYIPFLIFAQIIYSSHMVFDFGIQIKNKTKIYAYVCTTTLVINLLANYFGIKYLGPSAAPVIKLVTYSVYFIAIFTISQRLYKVRFEKRSLIAVILSAIMVVVYLTFSIKTPFVVRLAIILGYTTVILLLFIQKDEKEKLLSFLSK